VPVDLGPDLAARQHRLSCRLQEPNFLI